MFISLPDISRTEPQSQTLTCIAFAGTASSTTSVYWGDPLHRSPYFSPFPSLGRKLLFQIPLTNA